MRPPQHEKDREITIRELYPDLNYEQLVEAEENLDRYIEHAIRMYRRIQSDPQTQAQFMALTDLRLDPTIEESQSNPHTNVNS